MQAGRYLRSLGLFGAAVGFDFLIEFVCPRPIDERVRHFLPFVALRAQVTDAIAFDFPFRSKLVGTVFQDESLGQLLSRGGDKQGERCCYQQKEDANSIPCSHDPSHRFILHHSARERVVYFLVSRTPSPLIFWNHGIRATPPSRSLSLKDLYAKSSGQRSWRFFVLSLG